MATIHHLPPDESRGPMPAARWLILLAVWGIGLMMWAAYLIAFTWLFFTFFA